MWALKSTAANLTACQFTQLMPSAEHSSHIWQNSWCRISAAEMQQRPGVMLPICWLKRLNKRLKKIRKKFVILQIIDVYLVLMFWNVMFIYNAFIRTTDHCKVQTTFVSLFYIFINIKPWNASNSSVVVVGLLLIMLNGTLNANLLILPRPLGHLMNFCTFLKNFYNFGKFVKIRKFFLLR